MGEAGTGQCSLCFNHRGMDKWSVISGISDASLLSLTQTSIASAKSLPELSHNYYEFEGESCSTVEIYLSQKNIHIIADGWDQLCESESREGTFMYGLLFVIFSLAHP